VADFEQVFDLLLGQARPSLTHWLAG